MRSDQNTFQLTFATLDYINGDNYDYFYLLDNYDCVFERYDINGDKCYMMGDYINFGVTYFYGNKRIIDGIPVLDVCEIIKLKRGLNRDKDLEDLKLLMMYKRDN